MNQERIFTKYVWLGALICCALWGSAIPGIKLGYHFMNIKSAETGTQILFAGVRFFFAGVLAIIIGSFFQKEILIPHKKSISKILILSMLQTVAQYVFFYLGLAHIRGTNTAIINSTSVFLSILISGYLFHQENVTIRKIIGCLIGFLGVILITTSANSFLGFALTGEGFIFLSNIAYAFSSVFIKKFSKDENPVTLSGWQFMVGGLIMTVYGLVLGGRLQHITLQGIGILIWLAFVSAVAYSLWGLLLKYNPVSKVAVFGFMTPVFGVLLSQLLLKESDNTGIITIIALVLVCLGIYICNSNPIKE